MKIFQTSWPWLIFFLVTATILFPWVNQPGYIFLLDFVWGPVSPALPHIADTVLIGEWLLIAVYRIMTTFIPPDLLQKIAIACLFILLQAGMFFLSRNTVETTSLTTRNIAALSASSLYAFNPFVITRFYMGQYFVLFAYALLPVIFSLVQKLQQRTTRRDIVFLFLLFTIVSSVSPHFVIIINLLLLPFFIRKNFQTTLRKNILVLGIIVGVPFIFLLHRLLFSTAAFGINPISVIAFAPQAIFTQNIWVDALTLTATWKTNLPFLLPHEISRFFPWIVISFLLLLIVGLLTSRKHSTDKKISAHLVTVFCFSLVLAVGIASPLTEDMAKWLYTHIPYWIGLRDSAKWLALVAFCYALWIGSGIAYILNRINNIQGIKKIWLHSLFFLFLGLLFIGLVWPTTRSFSGQLYPKPYPTSWYEFNSLLAEVSPQPRVLFLPWHQYLSFSFSDNRVISNPAPRFFSEAEIISGDNAEIRRNGTMLLYSESQREISKKVEDVLQHQSSTDLYQLLQHERIKFIVLAKDTTDVSSYDWLYEQPFLQPLMEKEDFIAWQFSSVN